MRRVFALLNTACGLALAAVPFGLAPVCAGTTPGGGHMRCYYAAILFVLCGVAVLTAAILALAFRSRVLNWLSRLVSLGAALLCLLAPLGIVPLHGNGWAVGLCADSSHACRAATMTAACPIAVALLVLNVLALIWAFVKGEE